MEHYYLCPKCKSKIFLPICNICGYEIPFINSIYRFCNDVSIKLEGNKQYIGYDDIGEDFEPEVTYWDANNTDRYGVYAACGDLMPRNLGRKSVFLIWVQVWGLLQFRLQKMAFTRLLPIYRQ